MKTAVGLALLSTLLSAATAPARLNLPPTIEFSPDPLVYPLGSGVKIVDATATVSDPDSPDMAFGQLTVSLEAPEPDALLTVLGAGSLTVAGSNIKQGATTVGAFAFDALVGSLDVAFTAAATLDVVQNVVRGVAYQNVTTVEPQTRQLSFVLSDGDGGISIPAVKTIQIGTSTDAPPRSGDALRIAASPNPFNPRTSIHYELPSSGHARVAIFDLAGRQLRTLVDATLPAGAQSALWDGRDDAGRDLASGLYFARVESAGKIAVAKLTLLR